jgi:abortive infection bacteriophage resistance protein
LVSDPKRLLVAVCVFNNWTFQEILDTYLFDEHALIRFLATLDKMKLIELQPKNRIKLLMSADFAWIPKGPINRFFEEQVKDDFFKSHFNGPGEIRLFTSGMLSRASNEVLLRKINGLAKSFRQLNDDDKVLPLSKRFGTSMMIAMRPWELTVFEQYRRDNSKRF